MKKITLNLVLLLFITSFLVSCVAEESSSVDQSRIWTGYELFYDKNENKTYAKAAFKFGNGLGTSLQLSEGSSVRFNNEVLPYNGITAMYEKVYDGFITTGTFTFQDNEGNQYVNTVPTIAEIAWPEGALTMQRGVDYVMTWQGTPLGPNEDVGSTISTTLFLQLLDNVTTITYGGVQLNAITAGPYIGVLDRYSLTAPTQAPEAGGLMTAKYRAQNKAIELVN